MKRVTMNGNLSESAFLNRRTFAGTALATLLAGCAIVPKSADVPPPAPTPTPEPSATALPTDETRHRIALLVPMTGNNGAVGQSIANATTMALLDTNASNLRITTYDTGTSARDAARRAIADGNKLILGPLMGDNVARVASLARPANVPVISFSNDTRVAAADVFVMGHMPEQSIARSVEYARSQGARDFAILTPQGEYGRRAEAALQSSIARYGGQMSGVERYSRGNTSIVSAAQRLADRGGFDSVLIADGVQLANRAAGQLRPGGEGTTRIMGTELWSGETAITRASAMRGAIFSAVPDKNYERFVTSYTGRFGGQPYRIATLGYDAVLLTLRVSNNWQVGRDFPTSQLRDDGGFLGLDGAFRFQRTGVVQRAMEVRQVNQNGVTVIDSAPNRFDN